MPGPANSESWKRVAFSGGVALPYTSTFTSEELRQLQLGLVPREMEDKWFIYFEAPHLFFHRSWTGQPVYRVTLDLQSTHAEVLEALWATELANQGKSTRPYEAQLLDFLVSNLLLGKSKPFPVPESADGTSIPTGVYQHHVSGTGYKEQVVPGRPKPWWRFW